VAFFICINMKKAFVILAVVALLASCKKDYTCTCYAGTALEAKFEFSGLSKSEAETQQDSCETNAACSWAVQ
jgi:hypothetical protein